MVEKRGDKWCVVHGHPEKPGSETDKPEGSVIKCYDFNPNTKGSEAVAKSKANKMHQAILISQKENKIQAGDNDSPEVKRAKNVIVNGLKSGSIKKPLDCFKCKKISAVEAHHYNGYDEDHMFDIKWLCQSCHIEAHRELRIINKVTNMVQTFQSKVVLFEKKIQSFSHDEILKRIPFETLEKIKEKDPNPFFQMYSLCHEGISTPTIIGEKAKPITWTRRAIQSIKNIILKGIQLFRGHNKDSSTKNRKSVGEIVHDFQEEIKGKLHHLIITYHNPEVKEEAKECDICSQEAEWNFFEQAGKLFADTIDNITGVAVENSKLQTPAFLGAKRLAFVQAFENKNTTIKGDFMSDEIISDGELRSGSKQISFETWLGLKKLFHVYPRQLVSLDELKADREFGKYFEELEKLKEQNTLLKSEKETVEQTLKTEKETIEQTLKTEINTLNRKLYIGSAGTRLNKIMEVNNYPEKMKKFLNKAFETNKEKIEDLTDEGLGKFVKTQTETFQHVMSLIEEEPPVPGTTTEPPDTTAKDSKDIGKAENNEFLEEDIDEELEFFETED